MKIAMAYSGKVSGFSQFLQSMMPENVILLSTYRQKNTTSAKVASKKVGNKIVSFILPDNIA